MRELPEAYKKPLSRLVAIGRLGEYEADRFNR